MERSAIWYSILVSIVALARLGESALSHQHVRALRARGAVESGARQLPRLVLLHATWLCSCVAEVWWLHRPCIPWLAVTAGVMLCASTALRIWAIASLGVRWSQRVLVLPGVPLVQSGPYRWLRHPNYCAVTGEIAALPLIHGAWITAGLFSALSAVQLRQRIAVEERALADVTPPAP